MNLPTQAVAARVKTRGSKAQESGKENAKLGPEEFLHVRSFCLTRSQLLEGGHDRIAVSGALAEPLVPASEAFQRRPVDLHLVIAIERGADDDIGHRKIFSRQKAPPLQLR